MTGITSRGRVPVGTVFGTLTCLVAQAGGATREAASERHATFARPEKRAEGATPRSIAR